MDHQILVMAFLVVAGAFTGVISSVAGSGGLLITPLLLFIGLSPLQTIATQNLYSVSTHISASWYFGRRGHLPANIASFVPGMLIFGAAGAFCVGMLPTEMLKKALPLALLGLAVWVALHPDLKAKRATRRLTVPQFRTFVAPALSFYNGFLSISSTTFTTLASLTLLGRSVVESTAAAKIFSAVSSLAAVVIFIIHGDIVWPDGLALAAGGILGGRIGSSLVIRHGAPLVRWIVIATSIAASLKLAYDQFGAALFS